MYISRSYMNWANRNHQNYRSMELINDIIQNNPGMNIRGIALGISTVMETLYFREILIHKKDLVFFIFYNFFYLALIPSILELVLQRRKQSTMIIFSDELKANPDLPSNSLVGKSYLNYHNYLVKN